MARALRMGRRKSWIVPIQIAVGILLVAFCDVSVPPSLEGSFDNAC